MVSRTATIIAANCSNGRLLPSMPSLNPAQRDAVRHVDGPLLVLAGAGSGKTRVIAAKIAHLIERGVAPASIVAITFTNKAAREMRERARELVTHARPGDASVAGAAGSSGASGGAAAVRISTFHALGLSILRAEHRALGLAPRFSILDPGDLEPIVAEHAGTVDRARARAIQARISRWKNVLVTPEAALAGATGDDERSAARAYLGYGEALRAWQAVDLDDLITLPLALFERDAKARTRWQATSAHFLIDEYQDTNPAQYRLFRALAGATTPFTAVGDDDQAIYGWRGASSDNLAALARDYPQLRVIKLEQNYRSTVRILRCANALIGNNPKLFEKRLWTELAARAVPYEVSGGTSMFERSEIKDLVAYLRLIANDDDDPAFLRAIAAPRRGVGEASLRALGRLAADHRVSLFGAAFR